MKVLLLTITFIIPLIIFSQTGNNNNSINNRKNGVVIKKVTSSVKIKEIPLPYPDEEFLKNNNVPESFPRYLDTGNSKEDLERYHNQKQKWIEEHPEEFEKIKHLKL